MMKYNLFTLMISTMVFTNSAQAQQLDFKTVKTYEHQLEDVMEIIDTTALKLKLIQVEQQFQSNPNEINKVRLGIIYHETALNLGFLSKTSFKGYSKKSYDVLTELFLDSSITVELLPFVSAYRASALSLVGGETMKLGLVGDAFKLFDESIKKYGNVCYCPEFLRGSVAENLPWFFFSKRKFAKIDMRTIVDKQESNSEFTNDKIMSFVYWAWANQRQSGRNRAKSLLYLDKAIELDPNYEAGRQKAEVLKAKMTK